MSAQHLVGNQNHKGVSTGSLVLAIVLAQLKLKSYRPYLWTVTCCLLDYPSLLRCDGWLWHCCFRYAGDQGAERICRKGAKGFLNLEKMKEAT